MRITPLISYVALLLVVVLWGAFGYMTWTLSNERDLYAEAESRSHEEALRGESATRLRASVRDTEAERTALEGILNITILQAVESIETAGKQAGATEVTIGEATPLPVSQGLMPISVVVTAKGSFSALLRAVSLFETLPLPTSIEQFSLGKTDKTWILTTRLKVIVASK